VTLTDQILDATPAHTQLDGEFPVSGAWPSGDGVQGGIFQFELTISG
jgi:hypothetical protein